MITLYTFGPGFGLPDPSPFVLKADLLLKLAGLDYETDTGGFGKAPKGKLPYIRDEDEVIADSSLIRHHIETKYGFDFDEGLDARERGLAVGLEKMLEDHLYWMLVRALWLDDANFDRGFRRLFDRAPAPIRPMVIAMVRRKIRKNAHGQGMGRYTDEEQAILCGRAVTALSDVLGERPYMMGERMCGLDATAFAFVACASNPVIEGTLSTAMKSCGNLRAYRDRIMKAHYPAFA